MKLTPSAPFRLEPCSGGYTIVVPVPCNHCDASGTIAHARTHHATRYDNCAGCHGTGRVSARRKCYPFADGSRAWFVLGWANRVFASADEAALAVVAALRPAPYPEREPRDMAEIVADVTQDVGVPG